ncbi:diacylglycerol/lipid kinase family protein [Aquimarina muelleri]|uniref:DAGKc domain-containing protein n=1 Tax=Aquimarina muelleri TaxID=279356 RepID=A0A918JWA2_9FLAO|nr:diacylglycerol kinase family protein [Aquimarina muelleri]MCX2762541.1 diacylglycerol kinase family protein [Aquimarina muelleri]GGX24333.1 hypothetical protein GCM10007384_26910 [Aquimarina muelleri]
MKCIHFIINPIAGSSNNIVTKDILQKYFVDDKYSLTIKLSTHKKHAIKLTKQSIDEGATIIVACGGDGTVNEVASCIVGTSIKLGIIPTGSGNGLASNLKIPKIIEKAITLIKQENITQIDVGTINEHYFFSNTGVGFDASVIKNYEASNERTLYNYIKASLKSFRELNKQEEVKISIDNKNTFINPFMIFVSNSNELGYKISLTPKASLRDGLLDAIIIPKISKIKVVVFGVLMLFRKHQILKKAQVFQTKSIHLLRVKGSVFETQIDGELYQIKEKHIFISLKEKSLNVIT